MASCLGTYEPALSYWNNALTMREGLYPPEHPRLVEIQNSIEMAETMVGGRAWYNVAESLVCMFACEQHYAFWPYPTPQASGATQQAVGHMAVGGKSWQLQRLWRVWPL